MSLRDKLLGFDARETEDHESTRMWMTALYRARLKKNLGTAEAVRHAGLVVLKSRRTAELSATPLHRAGFVAAGGWR